jgi:molybdenum cofactor synthesis domain-containing protein
MATVESRPALPTAALITVGTELITGDVVNENARWLGSRLAELGISVGVVVAVPDHERRVAHIVRWARDEHDVVFVTGGLGPTPDDVTRPAIARAFGVPMRTNNELRGELVARGGHSAVFADSWSLLPDRARVLAHLPGGAPAFAVENVFVLAGQPSEMRTAFEASVSQLPAGSPGSVWRRTFQLTEDTAVPVLQQVAEAHPAVSVGSYPTYGDDGDTLEIVLRAPTAEIVAAAAADVERQLPGARLIDA